MSQYCAESLTPLKYRTLKAWFGKQCSSHAFIDRTFYRCGVHWQVPHSSYTLQIWNYSGKHDRKILLGHLKYCHPGPWKLHHLWDFNRKLSDKCLLQMVSTFTKGTTDTEWKFIIKRPIEFPFSEIFPIIRTQSWDSAEKGMKLKSWHQISKKLPTSSSVSSVIPNLVLINYVFQVSCKT